MVLQLYNIAYAEEIEEGLEHDWQIQMLQVDQGGTKVWIDEELRY